MSCCDSPPGSISRGIPSAVPFLPQQTMTRLIVRLFAGAALAAAPSIVGAQNPETTPPTLPLKHTPEPTSAAISAQDLMTRLYIFADDSMMGRETGTRGHLMSTAYIANELKRMGLRP